MQAMATVDLIMDRGGDPPRVGGSHARRSTLLDGLRFRGRGAFAPDQQALQDEKRNRTQTQKHDGQIDQPADDRNEVQYGKSDKSGGKNHQVPGH